MHRFLLHRVRNLNDVYNLNNEIYFQLCRESLENIFHGEDRHARAFNHVILFTFLPTMSLFYGFLNSGDIAVFI